MAGSQHEIPKLQREYAVQHDAEDGLFVALDITEDLRRAASQLLEP